MISETATSYMCPNYNKQAIKNQDKSATEKFFLKAEPKLKGGECWHNRGALILLTAFTFPYSGSSSTTDACTAGKVDPASLL